MKLDLEPANAVRAATHPNPYPYYARLVQESPFFFDAEMQTWIAADARHVDAVFMHADARVVAPQPLAARVREHLARFNDGALHTELRSRIMPLLAALSDHDAATPALPEALSLDAFIRAFPIYAIADALQIQHEHVPKILEELAGGWASAPHFTAGFGIHPAVAGLVFQTYDATRGLVANTLLALLREGIQPAGTRGDAALRAAIDRTLRDDSPVQNTRRVLQSSTRIGDTDVHAGACMLLLIGAANRDPAASQLFTFGAGAHACPGQHLAVTIAESALRRIFEANLHRAADPGCVHYLPSLNARIPLFESKAQGGNP